MSHAAFFVGADCCSARSASIAARTCVFPAQKNTSPPRWIVSGNTVHSEKTRWERPQLSGRQRHPLLKHRRRRHAERLRRIDNGLGYVSARRLLAGFPSSTLRRTARGKCGSTYDGLGASPCATCLSRGCDTLLFWSLTKNDPALMRPLLECEVAPHDALGDQPSPLQHHRIEQLFVRERSQSSHGILPLPCVSSHWRILSLSLP